MRQSVLWILTKSPIRLRYKNKIFTASSASQASLQLSAAKTETELSATATETAAIDSPVSVVGVFLHVEFTETRLLLVIWLLLSICHRLPLCTCRYFKSCDCFLLNFLQFRYCCLSHVHFTMVNNLKHKIIHKSQCRLLGKVTLCTCFVLTTLLLLRFHGNGIGIFNQLKKYIPSILLMLELCISGHALSIFLLSSLAHTMKAFIGRLMCGLLESAFSFWDRIIFAPNIFAETKVMYDINFGSSATSKTFTMTPCHSPVKLVKWHLHDVHKKSWQKQLPRNLIKFEIHDRKY